MAQFGPGQAETKEAGKRKEAIKRFFIYRPENTRERVAVKLEFERLKCLPRLFRTQDVEKLTSHAGVLLSRAAQEGLVYRINRGNYVNSLLHGFPRVEEVACFLKPPAYVSCEWARHYHGTILQAPTVCTVVTLNTSVGKKRRVTYQGVTLEFSKISDSLFFGYSYHH